MGGMNAKHELRLSLSSRKDKKETVVIREGVNV